MDDAPGVAMEYKVHVDAAKEDCYWQYVHQGATLYVSAQVLKGGDNKIGVAVRDPGGKVVLPYKWQASAEYEEASASAGYWSVCLDNQFSKFSAKLVNLYLTTFRYDEWEKFAEDLQVCILFIRRSCPSFLYILLMRLTLKIYVPECMTASFYKKSEQKAATDN